VKKARRCLAVFILLLAGMIRPNRLQDWQQTTVASPAAGPSLTPAEQQATSLVKTKTIREVVTALVNKEMEGRGAAQAGGEKAARYIAQRMKAMGLKPLGGHRSYFQKVNLKGFRVLPESFVKIENQSLKQGQEIIVIPGMLSRTLLRKQLEVQGEIVFASYGVVSSVVKRDDLAGMDVKGKVVALVNGVPDKAKVQDWASLSLGTIVREVTERGAVGVLWLPSSADPLPDSLREYGSRRGAALLDLPSSLRSGLVPAAVLSPAAAEQLFARTGMTFQEALAKTKSGESVSPNLGKKGTLSIRIAFEPQNVRSDNVVGMLEGSDPKLKSQAIVYSAHYDAYGIQSDGKIYPGAADNALGVGNMLAIAEAMSSSSVRPRRSVVFLAATAEENGHLGSYHWINHPTWPLSKIAADLNFDGIGSEVWGPVGGFYGIGVQQSDLQTLLSSLSTAMGATLMPEADPAERLFQRSDNFEFAQRGIPTIYVVGLGGDQSKIQTRVKQFFNEHYHQVSDVVRDDWDWSGPKKLADFYLIAGLRIANEEALPTWLPTSAFNRSRGAEETGSR
jgi:Peptidase family M28